MKRLFILATAFIASVGGAEVQFNQELVSELAPPAGTDAIIYQGDVETNPSFITIQSDADGSQTYQFCRKDLRGGTNCQPFGDSRCTITSEKIAATIQSRIDRYGDDSGFRGAQWGAGILASLGLITDIYGCSRGRGCNRIISNAAKNAFGGAVGGFVLYDLTAGPQIQQIREDLESHGETTIDTTSGASRNHGDTLLFEVDDLQATSSFLASVTRQTCAMEIEAQQAQESTETSAATESTP